MTETGEAAYRYLDIPRKDMIGFIPVGIKSLLDVGCSRGGFGETLRQRALVETTGIELDPESAAVAAPRYDQVIVGGFPDDIPVGSLYDCIVFNDILEHLVDPWEALRSTHRFLAPGGTVVASIPNMRYWPIFWGLATKGEWKYVSDGILDRTHLRFFTASTVRDLFANTGFAATVTPINYVEFDQLERRSARVIKTICRFKPGLGAELRAQQFAVVATSLSPPAAAGTD